jgi:hypothetical protein
VVSASDNITMEDVDRLADLLWWMKGYNAGLKAQGEQSPFTRHHEDSIRKFREHALVKLGVMATNDGERQEIDL